MPDIELLRRSEIEKGSNINVRQRIGDIKQSNAEKTKFQISK